MVFFSQKKRIRVGFERPTLYSRTVVRNKIIDIDRNKDLWNARKQPGRTRRNEPEKSKEERYTMLEPASSMK